MKGYICSLRRKFDEKWRLSICYEVTQLEAAFSIFWRNHPLKFNWSKWHNVQKLDPLAGLSITAGWDAKISELKGSGESKREAVCPVLAHRKEEDAAWGFKLNSRARGMSPCLPDPNQTIRKLFSLQHQTSIRPKMVREQYFSLSLMLSDSKEKKTSGEYHPLTFTYFETEH